VAEERTMTVWNVTEGGGLTETGIKVFEGTDSNEQRAVTTAREPMRMLAYQEILKERKRSLFRQTWFLQGIFRDPKSPFLLLGIQDDDPDDLPTVHEEYFTN
jgi:hypothetical protein